MPRHSCGVASFFKTNEGSWKSDAATVECLNCKFKKGDKVMWGECLCVVTGVWEDGTYEVYEDGGMLADQHALETDLQPVNA